MEAKDLRVRARANLVGNWGVSIAVAVVACLLGSLITGASFLPSLNAEIPLDLPLLQDIADSIHNGVKIGNMTINFQAGIFGMASFILGGVIQLGYTRFLLKQHDGRSPEFNDLFSEFDRFGTGFAQLFLRNLYVTLWSLLLIVPGIVKSYSYSMTPFILSDHPNLSASRAIELSQQMMDGHKMDLFLLDLSFFGWNLLAALTLNLGYLALNPYENAARAAFYRQLQNANRYTVYE